MVLWLGLFLDSSMVAEHILFNQWATNFLVLICFVWVYLRVTAKIKKLMLYGVALALIGEVIAVANAEGIALERQQLTERVYRVIELTAEGELVREISNVLSGDYNSIITTAVHVGPGFFDSLPSCTS